MDGRRCDVETRPKPCRYLRISGNRSSRTATCSARAKRRPEQRDEGRKVRNGEGETRAHNTRLAASRRLQGRSGRWRRPHGRQLWHQEHADGSPKHTPITSSPRWRKAARRSRSSRSRSASSGEPPPPRGRARRAQGPRRGRPQLGSEGSSLAGDRLPPARVLLQDFTGVPAVVDLAAMREALAKLGGDPLKINPLQPVDLVIDHSVQVDRFASSTAVKVNAALEFERNEERYAFLRWGAQAFTNFRVVPPGPGHLPPDQPRVPRGRRHAAGHGWSIPDTLVGTDSHTTMINGLGVVGWGVGGIEAEAAMLGQPLSMLIPRWWASSSTAACPRARPRPTSCSRSRRCCARRSVVGKFVEFYGPGLRGCRSPDRATIANMSARVRRRRCGYLPDRRRDARATCASPAARGARSRWSRPTARSRACSARRARRGARLQRHALSSTSATVVPSIAGPKRPQDRVAAERREARLPRLAPGHARGGGAAAADAPDGSRRSPSTDRRARPRPGRAPLPALDDGPMRPGAEITPRADDATCTPRPRLTS